MVCSRKAISELKSLYAVRIGSPSAHVSRFIALGRANKFSTLKDAKRIVTSTSPLAQLPHDSTTPSRTLRCRCWLLDHF